MIDSSVIPSVHNNGTDKDILREHFVEANEALLAAIEALIVMMPDERDYYVQGAGVIDVARKQHRDRISKVQGVRDDLMSMFDEMDQQGSWD